MTRNLPNTYNHENLLLLPRYRRFTSIREKEEDSLGIRKEGFLIWSHGPCIWLFFPLLIDVQSYSLLFLISHSHIWNHKWKIMITFITHKLHFFFTLGKQQISNEKSPLCLNPLLIVWAMTLSLCINMGVSLWRKRREKKKFHHFPPFSLVLYDG